MILELSKYGTCCDLQTVLQVTEVHFLNALTTLYFETVDIEVQKAFLVT